MYEVIMSVRCAKTHVKFYDQKKKTEKNIWTLIGKH